MRRFVVLAVVLSLLLVWAPGASAHLASKPECRKWSTHQLHGLAPWNRDYVHWRAGVRVCWRFARRHRWTHRVPWLLARIGWCESRNDYRAQNRRSTASGRYQYLDSTWGGHMGYAKARYAPRWVQDRRAIRDFRRVGTRPWVASRDCWG